MPAVDPNEGLTTSATSLQNLVLRCSLLLKNLPDPSAESNTSQTLTCHLALLSCLSEHLISQHSHILLSENEKALISDILGQLCSLLSTLHGALANIVLPHLDTTQRSRKNATNSLHLSTISEATQKIDSILSRKDILLIAKRDLSSSNVVSPPILGQSKDYVTHHHYHDYFIMGNARAHFGDNINLISRCASPLPMRLASSQMQQKTGDDCVNTPIFHAFDSLLRTASRLGPGSAKYAAKNLLPHVLSILTHAGTMGTGRAKVDPETQQSLLHRAASTVQLTQEVYLAKMGARGTQAFSSNHADFGELEKRNTVWSGKSCALNGQLEATLQGSSTLAENFFATSQHIQPKTSKIRNRKLRRSMEIFDTFALNSTTPIFSTHVSHQDIRTRHAVAWYTGITRVDLITETKLVRSSSFAPHDEAELLSVRVVLTPEPQQPFSQQLLFRSQQMRQGIQSIVSPTFLQVRNMRHHSAPIFELAKYGTVTDILQFVASRQGSLTDCDECGRSLLSYAVRRNNYEMIKHLIDEGAEVDCFEVWMPEDSDEETPTHILINSFESLFQQRDTTSFMMMLSYGADPTIEDPDGFCIALFTMPYCSSDSVKVMLDYGYPFVSPNHMPCSPWSPLHSMVRAHTTNSDSFIEIANKIALLLSRGADFTELDSTGNNLLHLVMKYDRDDPERKRRKFENIVTPTFDGELKDILMLFTTAGVDVFAVNYDKQTAHDLALIWGHHREWREALLECGFDWDEVAKMRVKSEARSSSVDFNRRGRYKPALSFNEYMKIRRKRHSVEGNSDGDAYQGGYRENADNHPETVNFSEYQNTWDTDPGRWLDKNSGCTISHSTKDWTKISCGEAWPIVTYNERRIIADASPSRLDNELPIEARTRISGNIELQDPKLD